MTGKADKVAFIHIPKTAGTSVTSLLARHLLLAPPNYGDLLQYRRYVASGDYSLFAGHFTFAEIREVLPDARFLTFLRNPISRCFSVYRSFHDKAKLDPEWQRVISDEERTAIEFFQDRSFEDTLFSDDPWVIGRYKRDQTYFLADDGVTGPEAVASAMRNLESQISCLGIFELMELSMLGLAAEFGLDASSVSLPWENASEVDMPSLSSRGAQRLEQLAERDLELYRGALLMFDKRAAAYSRKSCIATARDSVLQETGGARSASVASGPGTFSAASHERDKELLSSRGFWHLVDLAYDAKKANQRIRCIVCDLEDQRENFKILVDRCQFGGGMLERYQCPECDCIFGPLKYLELGDELVNLDYEQLYSWYREADSTSDAIQTFHSLRPVAEEIYLDWGSGGDWSQTLPLLRSSGWNVWGYEPFAPCRNEFVVSRRGEISARFHGIFSNNVIEHLRDPKSQFEDFHCILAEGGRMAHSTACYEYKHSNTRFHTLFLLGRSVEVLAARTGFKVVARMGEGDYMNVVFERIDGPGQVPTSD